jgi:aminoglycoside/choline kinase family phosphotransferase
MAGLRRYLDASDLRLGEIAPIPLPDTVPGTLENDAGTRLRAMSVGVSLDGEQFSLPLVLKEPPVSENGRVLRAVGQREYGVYLRLGPHLPLLVPGLVVGDEQTGWFVLEVLTNLRPAPAWQVEDYDEAIQNLVSMHDRFWGLSEDLANYPWLAQPFGADYADTIMAAADAAHKLIADAPLPQLAPYFDTFSRLIQVSDEIAAPLRNTPATLIHGDYWPGNIARPIDGRQIVFDWQLAGMGPAILDIVCFAQAVRLHLDPPQPVETMIQRYRRQSSLLTTPTWDDAHFNRLWDHAVMWLFMMKWLGKLANMPPNLYARIHERFVPVWLEPVTEALKTHIG